jgi:hypothetical protein
VPAAPELTVGILTALERRDDGDGVARYSELLATTSRVLVEHGEEAHREPARVEPFTLAMYGYEGLHALRRVAAHLAASGTVPEPLDDVAEEAHLDPVVRAYYRAATRDISQAAFPHLMLHSDAEGLWVPAPLGHVIVPDPAIALEGGAVGSSAGLLAECEVLAAALELPEGLDVDGDGLWDAAHGIGDRSGWRGRGVEAFTCLRLRAVARRSVDESAALVLHAPFG